MHRRENSIQSLALDFINTKDERAFSKLTYRLKPGLLGFVKKIVPDIDLCKEIVSVTFISVWEKIEQYSTKYNFSTWVYAIARNEALGQLRNINKNVSRDKLIENNSRILRVNSQPIYLETECMIPCGEELIHKLYELTMDEIYNLKEPYKTLMLEREVNKKQLGNIAEDLGWNLNTVKTRLTKARKDIADNLAIKYPELIEAYNEN